MPLRAEPCAPAWPLALAEPLVPAAGPAFASVLPWAAPEPDTSTDLSPALRTAPDVRGSRRGCVVVASPDGWLAAFAPT